MSLDPSVIYLASRKRNALLKRDKLFAQAAAALNSLGICEEICVCPLCCTAFGRDALNDRVLTLEHVPPRSVGGREIILTCKNCNNYAGVKYDHHMKLREDFESAQRAVLPNAGDGVGYFQLEVLGLKVNAHLASQGNRKLFTMSPRHNNWHVMSAFQEHISKFRAGDEFKVKFTRGYNKRRVRIAEMKSAFLAISAKFGFSFSLKDELSLVRSQLLDIEGDHFDPATVSCKEMPCNKILLDERQGLVFIRFQRLVHVLPWINHSYENFERHRTNQFRSNASGKLFELPNSFEAMLDHAGFFKDLLIITPPEKAV